MVMDMLQQVHIYINQEMENYSGDHFGILIMWHGGQQNMVNFQLQAGQKTAICGWKDYLKMKAFLKKL